MMEVITAVTTSVIKKVITVLTTSVDSVESSSSDSPW